MKKVGKTTRSFRYDLNQIPYDYAVEVANRFTGLDVTDREPEELWTEVHDIVQKTVIKIILKKKKCKKAKWLSEEVLQTAMKRREAKVKGEKKRYTHVNVEFQRMQGKIRKISSVINAKKYRKTIEWERLEISSRNLEIQGNISCKDGDNKRQKSYGPKRSRQYKEEVARIHRRTMQKRSSQYR